MLFRGRNQAREVVRFFIRYSGRFICFFLITAFLLKENKKPPHGNYEEVRVNSSSTISRYRVSEVP